MLAILNDVLDLSKIEAGKLELDINDFDLHDALRETCAIAGAQARAKRLELDLRIHAEVPRLVRGDRRRCARSCSTSHPTRSSSPRGQGHAQRLGKARCERCQPSPHRGRATPASASSPTVLAQLFEHFTQADVSTTRHFGGTGLGLAIARELVEMMGGTISAASEPGVGSTFRIELELERAGSSSSDERRANDGRRGWSFTPHVLVVEDIPVNQFVVARALERIGARSTVVADGEQAVAAARQERFDAVLMDCHMPKMDGFEATAAIRRLKGQAGRVPIIAMTARAMDDDRQRCLAAGMDDYLSKPMRRTALAEALQRWIPATGSDAQGRQSEAA